MKPLLQTRRAVIVVAASVAVLLLSPSSGAQPALAHGKELDIAVTTLIPDLQQPLLRLYRVRVAYKNDGEPVRGAAVRLSGGREDSASTVPALVMAAMDNDRGIYVGEVSFPRFGVWQMHLNVEAALDQGDGQVEFTNDIRPGAIGSDQQAALRAEAERVLRLQLSFGFHWWPDVVSIAMRIIHSVGGIVYFAIVGLAFVLAWFGVPSRRPDFSRQLGRLFLPAAATSLGLLIATGLYSAAFDAPIAWPGVFAVSHLRQIPYGDAYLAGFLVKPILFLTLAVLAVRTHRTLRIWNADDSTDVDGSVVAAFKRVTLLSAVVGLAVMVDVAVVIYLHYLSHLGVFLPST